MQTRIARESGLALRHVTHLTGRSDAGGQRWKPCAAGDDKLRRMGEQSGASIETAQRAETQLVARNVAAVDTDGAFQRLLQSAHEQAHQYARRLDSIEVEVNESAGRVNLNNPASARQFLAFLVDKQREILAILADARTSASGMAEQMATVGANYQDVPDKAAPNGNPAPSAPSAPPGPSTPPPTPAPAPPVPGAPEASGPDAAPQPPGTRPAGWLSPTHWVPDPEEPEHTEPTDTGGTGSTATGPRIPDSVVRPASFHAPLRQDSGATDTTADNSINPGSSWDTRTTPAPTSAPHYHQDPNVPNTAADDSINPGGTPHSTGPGQRPITLDPNALGPRGYVEQVPHSGQWVPADQADPNVFTVAKGALAPYNSEQIGTAPNGDTIWRRTNPGPR